ncbi:MAG: hypothetical protein KGL53_15875, partial [Elusimicrobia bacterium]|nr:hypothetical protein [Elusimicrobiota bacterium]
MLQPLILAALLAPSARAQSGPPPPEGWKAHVAQMAGDARKQFKEHPSACAGLFGPDRIREFMLVYTAGRKSLDAQTERIQELAVDEAACRAASSAGDGPCLGLAAWEGREGEKLGARARLASACRA